MCYFWFDFHPTFVFLLGALLVTVSMYLYSLQPAAKPKSGDEISQPNTPSTSLNGSNNNSSGGSSLRFISPEGSGGSSSSSGRMLIPSGQGSDNVYGENRFFLQNSSIIPLSSESDSLKTSEMVLQVLKNAVGLNCQVCCTLWIALLSVIVALFVVNAVFTPKFNYKGKHVLITGGSSGIGLEVAREYLRLGANVTIVARDVAKLDAAKKDLDGSRKSDTQKVLTVSLDTSKGQEAVDKALAAPIGQLGDVEVLINCAGVSIAGAFEDLDASEFERMLRINVLGSVYPTRTVLPAMKRRGGGRIVFVSSQVAQAAIHGYTAYAASKWALRGLAEALQMECKPYNIFVSVSYPPDTDTPGYKVEMTTKPDLTKSISESGSVFSPKDVAVDLVNYSTQGYFGISTGLDGWLLKQLHPGMSPVNNVLEVTQQVLFASLARFIAIFYILSWDSIVKAQTNKESKKSK